MELFINQWIWAQDEEWGCVLGEWLYPTKKSNPVTWVMSCTRHLQEGILGNWTLVGLEPRLGPTKDVWDQTKDTCNTGSSQRDWLLKSAVSFHIFSYANLHRYSCCPCLIYTRAPHSVQVQVMALSHQWLLTFPSSVLAAKGKQGAHALTDRGDSVLPASPWWCHGQVYGSVLRVKISDLQRFIMLSMSLPW